MKAYISKNVLTTRDIIQFISQDGSTVLDEFFKKTYPDGVIIYDFEEKYPYSFWKYITEGMDRLSTFKELRGE